jgi:peptidoglycan/xylan/chitin deacetylase (PgdA/CDA1 family)
MNTRHFAKQLIPGSFYSLGANTYASIRQRWLSTVVGSDTPAKIAALTFDDGPSEFTPQILNILHRYQLKATFYLLGKNVAAHPEVARDILRQGHAIGNHTYSHPYLSDINPIQVAEELRRCQEAIEATTGVKPRTMRPPHGAQTLSSYLVSRMLGYTTVHWSASGDDWTNDPAPVVADRVLKKVKPGSIILLHDGIEPADTEPQQDRAATVTALSTIIETLQSLGYQFVTVPQLLHFTRLSRKIWFVKSRGMV